MDPYRACTMESPLSRGFSRKPFGELTNNGWSCTNQTPVKTDVTSPAQQEEALTPMANLKMLIRVASETDQLPSKRELFRESMGISENESSNGFTGRSVGMVVDEDEEEELPADLSMKTASAQLEKSTSLDHDYWTVTTPTFGSQQENMTPSPCGGLLGPPKVSRKQKSLGLLCEKFISRFPESVPEGEKCEIPLDDLAKSMATERRRIYDIVNVLEAVQMMTKVGKNLYQWHGTTHWLTTLAWLRQLAIKLKMLDRYNEVKVMEENDPNFGLGYSVSPSGSLGTPKGASPFTPTYSPCSSAASGPSPSPAERKTSLGVACQKFLMLFLIAPEPNAKINLEFAAKVIHGPILPEAVMKTRIRRLYDIANILQSLQLIKKVQVTETNGGKKPAYEYTGPNIERMELTQEVLQTLPSTRQRNSLLAVGRSLDMPDDEPAAASTTSSASSTMSAANFPVKKRFNDVTASRFVTSKENNTFGNVFSMTEEIQDEEMPQNLSKKNRTSSSLMDLSKTGSLENRQQQPIMINNRSTSIYSSTSFSSTSLSSSNSSLSNISLKSSASSLNSSPISRSISFPVQQSLPVVGKRPLQLSSQHNPNNVRLVQIEPAHYGSNPFHNFGSGPKKVITLISPTNHATHNIYPAVQRSPVSLVMRKVLK